MDESAGLSQRLKEHARALGFDHVGIAPARPGPHAHHLDGWLACGYAARMAYLARDPERRKDPRFVLPGAQSVIVCALAYAARDSSTLPADRPRIADFAHGRDYHLVVGEKLRALEAFLHAEAPEAVQSRAYVDTGPVLEREAAFLAGIGRYGKNTTLIHPTLGSRFFIGVVITTVLLEHDQALAGDPCGSCTRCLKACPTGALRAPYELDARRCLSYLTIEHRGVLPQEARPALGNRVFGCDACQEACPWNARLPQQPASPPVDDAPSLLDLLHLPNEEFSRRFGQTPVKRAKWSGLRRNAAIALGNTRDPAAIPALTRALADSDPLLRAHAAWALGRIGTPEAVAALRAALATETDPAVIAEIQAAQRLAAQ